MNGSVRSAIVALLLAGAVSAPSLALADAPDPAASVGAKPAADAKPAPSSMAGASGAKPAATGTGPTRAQVASGKKHLAAAGKLYKAGDFAGALAEYQAADADDPTADSALGIAQSQEKLGHAQEAVTSYEQFLALSNAPDAKGNAPKHTKAAQQSIDDATAADAALKKSPGKLHVDSDPMGAEVHVDGLDTAYKTPFDLDLAPGTHALHATAEGKTPADQSVDVAFAGKTSTTITMQPLPVPPPAPVAAPPPAPIPPAAPPPTPFERRSLLPVYATAGLAVAGVVVGSIYGAKALSDKSDFDKNPTASKADDGENHALVADMAFGIAVTMAVTSAILYLTRDEPALTGQNTLSPSTKNATRALAKAKPKLDLAPMVTPHGGGAGALLRF